MEDKIISILCIIDMVKPLLLVMTRDGIRGIPERNMVKDMQFTSLVGFEKISNPIPQPPTSKGAYKSQMKGYLSS